MDKPDRFSFKGASLYRNKKTNQLLFASKIKQTQVEEVKNMPHLIDSLTGQYVMKEDYIILKEGRLSFEYGLTTFDNDHILIR